MSVTFSTEWVDGAHVITCGCGAYTSAEVFPSYADARDRARTMGGDFPCQDKYCVADGHLSAEPQSPEPELNVSNANAATLLDVLGIGVPSGEDEETAEDRYCGVMAAEDFLGRVLIAQALSPVDAGVPATRSGNWVDGGRAEGYVNDRLDRLRTVASRAVELGVPVTWG